MYPPQPDRQTGNYYVGWRLEEPNWGSQGHINIWDTPGPTSPEASIAQLNISAGTHGTTLQTIEAGKIEKVPLTGDQRPHFFVYYTTNAYSNVGDWEGGYNIADKGFIQYLFSRAPNMVLTSSVSGGRQVDLGVTIYYDKPCDGCGGNWWVAFNSQWVGYYPYCKGGTDRPPCSDYPDPDNPNGPLLPGGELFSASGLRDGASRLDWYGEVHNPWAPTSTDMGNGIFPSSGSDGTAAYFRSLLYRHDRHLLSMTRALTTGSFYITDPNCYDGSGPQFNLGTGYPDRLWHNHFFYGGPGKEAPACR